MDWYWIFGCNPHKNRKIAVQKGWPRTGQCAITKKNAGSGDAETGKSSTTHNLRSLVKIKNTAIQLGANKCYVPNTQTETAVSELVGYIKDLWAAILHKHCTNRPESNQGSQPVTLTQVAGTKLRPPVCCRFTCPIMWFYNVFTFDLTSLFLFFFVLIFFADYLKNRNPHNSPPGPFAFPFVGNFFTMDNKHLHKHFSKVRVS